MCNILQAFPDNAAKREVEALEAVCINEGCNWTGTIKEYEVGISEAVIDLLYKSEQGSIRYLKKGNKYVGWFLVI